MRKLALTALWLICVLGLSACKSGGGVAPPVCPVLQEPPASLMQPPTTEAKVRQELLEPQLPATPK